MPVAVLTITLVMAYGVGDFTNKLQVGWRAPTAGGMEMLMSRTVARYGEWMVSGAYPYSCSNEPSA